MNPLPPVIDAVCQVEIIQSLLKKISDCYVFPEDAGRINDYLNQRLAEGAYADISDGSLFALALTIDLQEISHDEHLWVRWHTEPLPEEDSLRQNAQWQEERRLEARLENCGFHKVQRLPGNIAFLDLRYLHRPEWAAATLSAAMNFLADAEALILDLRKCSGGYPATISLLCSYFFGAEPVHTSSIYWRDENITQEYWTQPDVPGRRFGDRPIYVLISRGRAGRGAANAKTRHPAGRQNGRRFASRRVLPHSPSFRSLYPDRAGDQPADRP
jgi:hypothetical protein